MRSLVDWREFMGYNSRALRLRDAAKTIVVNFDGHVPRDLDVLMTIKGIGSYTASAILNFAFGIPTPCIDTNIRRILHRFFVGPENSDGTWKKNDAYLNDLAEKVLMTAIETYPKTLHRLHTTVAAEWHAALMDFGSLVSTKNNPKWESMNQSLKSVFKAYGKEKVRTKKLIKREPGREVGGRHIPNRIFRGRIVELLRDHPQGLKSDVIGKNITNDWTMGDHKKWLEGILTKLEKDKLIRRKGMIYQLP
jgi:A/G-specific adenine glycosylase